MLSQGLSGVTLMSHASFIYTVIIFGVGRRGGLQGLVGDITSSIPCWSSGTPYLGGVLVAFSSRARFWENVRQFIPRLRLFFKVEISSRKLISLFRPGSVHRGSAS